MSHCPIPLTALIEAHEALHQAAHILVRQQEHDALSTRCARAYGALEFYIRANSPEVEVSSLEQSHG